MPDQNAPQHLTPYEGYSMGAQLRHAVDEDGSPSYTCVLTATRMTEHSTPFVFERTLVLSQAQAALRNRWQPGTVPPPDDVDAGLVTQGTNYMHNLIDVVNRGFDAIARANTLSLSEARSRIGMSDAALRTREQ